MPDPEAVLYPVPQRGPDSGSYAHHALAFGARWQSDFPLPAFESASADTAPAGITVRRCTEAAPPRAELARHHRIHHTRDGIRFVSEEFVADTYGRARIDVTPGAAWPGHLLPSFFGTVTAAMLTWRGGIAMHGSAVALDGEAVLLCGTSGAGKSTLTAALLAAGARLISDDLSVLQPQGQGKPPLLFAGRRTLRLFPDVAAMLSQAVHLDQEPQPADRKVLVIPPRTDPRSGVPLRCVLLLDGSADTNPALAALAPELAGLFLAQHLYRPRGFRSIPGHPLRLASLAGLARFLPVYPHARVEARDAGAFRALTQKAQQLCRGHTINRVL